MAAIDRVLYLGNATQTRWTNSTVSVPRIYGKIALEEHVGTTVWAKYNVTPPSNQIAGRGVLPSPGVGIPNDRSPARHTNTISSPAVQTPLPVSLISPPVSNPWTKVVSTM